MRLGELVNHQKNQFKDMQQKHELEKFELEKEYDKLQREIRSLQSENTNERK
jgi:ABC-type phosphate transport system auxiliary subunit